MRSWSASARARRKSSSFMAYDRVRLSTRKHLRAPKLVLVLSMSLSLAPLVAQGRAPAAPAAETDCVELRHPLTSMGLATSYIAVLKHASVAESLTAHAGSITHQRDLSRDPEALAEMFYSFDGAIDEYRCAGQVLNPFSQAPDSSVRDFVVETRTTFESHAAWVRDLRSGVKRLAGGDSPDMVGAAEEMADMRGRRDALIKMTALNAMGLTYLLLERQSDSTMRLSLTARQRDSLLTQLRPLAAPSSPDVPGAAAQMLTKWLSQKWPTR